MNDDVSAAEHSAAITTTPEINADRQPANPQGWRISVLRVINRMSLWQVTVIAWLAWFMMCLMLLGTPRNSNIGLTQIAESWGAIERVALWQDALRWAWPVFELPPGVIAYGIRLSFIILFAVQAIVFWRALSTRNPSLWKWMIGPIGSHLVMLFMPPSNSDVFYYAMIGDLTSNGINPYLHQLQQFPDHPLLPYEHWIDIGTVYGPIWTNICGVIVSITGPDPVLAIIGFKLFASVVAIGLSLLVFSLARFITGKQSLAVAAAVLVAWQPNMTFESSGQVHNDPTVMLFATTGMALVIMGGVAAIRAGLVIVAVSFATKFITLPLLGITALLRLARPDNGTFEPRKIVGQWVVDAIAIVAVVLAAFLPYWAGYVTIHEMLAEPGRLFAHPIWRIGEALLQMLPTDTAVDIYRAVLRYGMQVLTLAIFAYVTWHFIRMLMTRSSSGFLALPSTPLPTRVAWWTRPLVVAWAIILATLSMLPVNAHPWYWTWPVIPIAILITMDLGDAEPEDRHTRLPRWFSWYLVATAVMTIIYHTRIARY